MAATSKGSLSRGVKLLKVFHLFANHKFTGPADPAMVLARAQSDLGADVVFFPGQPKDGASGVAQLAGERGLVLNQALRLSKHALPWSTAVDVARLHRVLKDVRPDVLHCHLANDHLIATLASRGMDIPLVRTQYDRKHPRGLRGRATYRNTSRIWVFSDAARDDLVQWIPEVGERARVGQPVLDCDRFSTERLASTRNGWGIPADAFVVGVVARMQTHRMFPELIAGFAQAAREYPDLHMVVLGRGTHQDAVAKEPASQSGAGKRIHFPGYIDSDEYARSLPAFDTLLFLVPGSDGTCRAAREALVSGVPVIASDRGLLPAIVQEDVNGLFVEEEKPAAIAKAIARLRGDPEERGRLAAGAAACRERFDSRSHAAVVLEDYEQVLV